MKTSVCVCAFATAVALSPLAVAQDAPQADPPPGEPQAESAEANERQVFGGERHHRFYVYGGFVQGGNVDYELSYDEKLNGEVVDRNVSETWAFDMNTAAITGIGIEKVYDFPFAIGFDLLVSPWKDGGQDQIGAQGNVMVSPRLTMRGFYPVLDGRLEPSIGVYVGGEVDFPLADRAPRGGASFGGFGATTGEEGERSIMGGVNTGLSIGLRSYILERFGASLEFNHTWSFLWGDFEPDDDSIGYDGRMFQAKVRRPGVRFGIFTTF